MSEELDTRALRWVYNDRALFPDIAKDVLGLLDALDAERARVADRDAEMAYQKADYGKLVDSSQAVYERMVWLEAALTRAGATLADVRAVLAAHGDGHTSAAYDVINDLRAALGEQP